MEGQANLPEAPKISDVLRRLADEFDAYEGNSARVTVEQGTPHQWACRVYDASGKEFEGAILSFE